MCLAALADPGGRACTRIRAIPTLFHSEAGGSRARPVLRAKSVVKQIRVLQVIWRVSRSGGAQAVARGFLAHYDRRQFEVHVCTTRPLFAEDNIEELGIGIRYHPLSLTGTPTPRLRLEAVKGIASVVRRVKPDLLHVHGGTAWYSLPGALAWRHGSRMIEVHDAPQSGRMSRENQIVERLMARRLGFQAVAHSAAVRDGIALSWKLDRDQISMVPLGVDVDTLARPSSDRNAIRRSLGIDDQAPLVTYVGRLVPEKRPELFVQVAARAHGASPERRLRPGWRRVERRICS